jgi:(1->4)-alpha-D-glucan 1-alpha-D-glucosylmutase
MPPAIPRATYRLQLSAHFGFDAVARIVPYLHDLGISHVYASPFLKSRAGSQHGYDITDHAVLNPEFGGEGAFERMSAALARADMGLILDFVPNHMGVGYADNAWWLDVLEWGAKSPNAGMFDIDWSTLPYRRQGGVLLPILGKPYGEALEQGEIALRFDASEGSFSCWYFDHRLPVRPDRYSEIVRTIVTFASAEREPAGAELLAIAEGYGELRAPSWKQAPVLKAALADVKGGSAVIDAGLAAYAPDPANPGRVVALHRLLDRQHYRLAHWRVAISEINYRRFFDINDLAGIRIEDPRTFRRVHGKIAALIAAGQLHGLRLDHIDGLYDPAQYCDRLQRLIQRARQSREPFYTVVEKILGPNETLRPLAGVAGTTGYDALSLISRVLVQNDGLPALEHTWQTQAAPSRNFAQMVEDAKSRVIEATMASEFTVLARLLARIAAGHWPSRDYTLDRLRTALELFVVNFPIYRTYIAGGVVSAEDRAVIAQAIADARKQWYGADISIFDFLQDALTLDLVAAGRIGYSSARVKRFAAKMQQFTGPVTAKAVEDTAFYRYHRLLALNEVGNDPSLPALSVAEFHKAMIARGKSHPHTMNATATHDTKRGEDARARLIALSEIADDWSAAVKRWTVLNARLVTQAKRRSPSRAHEYMLYQALVGAWPDDTPDAGFTERIKAYAVKAAREGKQETSWFSPDEDYEAALCHFVEQVLDRAVSAAFLDEFVPFARRVARLGALNSLAQLALKATVPGVPDFYQGTELWDLSLVDPDNRRPVDYDLRRRNLPANGCDTSGAITSQTKFALTRRLLALRARHADVFTDGTYEPLGVTGAQQDHAIAFARINGGEAMIVVAARHFAAMTDGGRAWPQRGAVDAAVQLGRFDVTRDALAGTELCARDSLPLGDLLAEIPVAILQARRSGSDARA